MATSKAALVVSHLQTEAPGEPVVNERGSAFGANDGSVADSDVETLGTLALLLDKRTLRTNRIVHHAIRDH